MMWTIHGGLTLCESSDAFWSAALVFSHEQLAIKSYFQELFL